MGIRITKSSGKKRSGSKFKYKRTEVEDDQKEVKDSKKDLKETDEQLLRDEVKQSLDTIISKIILETKTRNTNNLCRLINNYVKICENRLGYSPESLAQQKLSAIRRFVESYKLEIDFDYIRTHLNIIIDRVQESSPSGVFLMEGFEDSDEEGLLVEPSYCKELRMLREEIKSL